MSEYSSAVPRGGTYCFLHLQDQQCSPSSRWKLGPDVEAETVKLLEPNVNVGASEPMVSQGTKQTNCIWELVGGSLREERLDALKKRTSIHGLDPEGEYGWYVDLRRFGSAPHGGFGMGFERLMSWVRGI